MIEIWYRIPTVFIMRSNRYIYFVAAQNNSLLSLRVWESAQDQISDLQHLDLRTLSIANCVSAKSTACCTGTVLQYLLLVLRYSLVRLIFFIFFLFFFFFRNRLGKKPLSLGFFFGRWVWLCQSHSHAWMYTHTVLFLSFFFLSFFLSFCSPLFLSPSLPLSLSLSLHSLFRVSTVKLHGGRPCPRRTIGSISRLCCSRCANVKWRWVHLEFLLWWALHSNCNVAGKFFVTLLK